MTAPTTSRGRPPCAGHCGGEGSGVVGGDLPAALVEGDGEPLAVRPIGGEHECDVGAGRRELGRCEQRIASVAAGPDEDEHGAGAPAVPSVGEHQPQFAREAVGRPLHQRFAAREVGCFRGAHLC
jgi:hypothetical protein